MEQVYIGKGRALDPDKYYITGHQPDRQRAIDVAAQHAGIRVATATSLASRIGDDVHAQHKLLTERFGIDKLALGRRRFDRRAADL